MSGLFSLWHILHVPFVFMLVISGVVHVIAVHMYEWAAGAVDTLRIRLAGGSGRCVAFGGNCRHGRERDHAGQGD